MNQIRSCQAAHHIPRDLNGIPRAEQHDLMGAVEVIKARNRAIFQDDAIDIPIGRFQVVRELAVDGGAYHDLGLGLGGLRDT